MRRAIFKYTRMCRLKAGSSPSKPLPRLAAHTNHRTPYATTFHNRSDHTWRSAHGPWMKNTLEIVMEQFMRYFHAGYNNSFKPADLAHQHPSMHTRPPRVRPWRFLFFFTRGSVCVRHANFALSTWTRSVVALLNSAGAWRRSEERI